MRGRRTGARFAKVTTSDPLLSCEYDVSPSDHPPVRVYAGEERLAGIIASAMDAVITIDADQRIVLFNPSAERIFGVTSDKALGQALDRFMPDRFRDAHPRHIARFGATGITSRQMGTVSRLMALRDNGDEFPVEASISHSTVGGERLFTVVLRDVTDRVQAEIRIREQAELLNKVTNAIMVLDTDDRIAFWNLGAERLYGWPADEALGRIASEVVHTNARDETAAAEAELDRSGEWTGEFRESTRDGRRIVVASHWTRLKNDDGRVRGKIAIDIDVTEKNELEARFLRSQRLESVGTLVSGIAHDLNNVLTPILMAVRLLKKDKPGIDRAALLEVASASVERGTAIIRQLLSFAGGVDGQRIPTHLGRVVGEVRDILDHALPKSIRLEVGIADDLWPVSGDATQLSQVVMNLGVNARDAMPEGGTLTIAAENRILGGDVASVYPEGKPGPHVLLSVSDTGSGIPAEVLERIFDPFFTTKPFGQGTGLGLSTVLGIVKSHGGFLNVYSEVSHGTRFTAYLPALAGPATVTVVPPGDVAWEGRGERILIVDDEPLILVTAKAVLEASGYRVLTARGGAEALELFRERHRDIAAVLLDMMMPGMDGPTAMAAMKALDPRVKIVAASGLRLAQRPAEALAAGAIAFLKKPYSDSELLQTLTKLLRGTA